MADAGGQSAGVSPALTSPLGLSNKALCILSQAPYRGLSGGSLPMAA